MWGKAMRVGMALLVIAITGWVHPADASAAPALASSECVAPNAVADGDRDFSSQIVSALAERGLCVTIERFEDGRPWTLEIIDSGNPGPLWVIPHDNENAAFISGVGALLERGGVLVAVEQNGARCNGGTCDEPDVMDPNRIFADRSDACAPRQVALTYTRRVIDRRPAGAPIIALHSNDKGFHKDGDGGHGNVSINYHPWQTERRRFPADQRFPNARSPTDTLVFVAGLQRDPSAAQMTHIRALNLARINVIYEIVSETKTDCSLSNYAAIARMGPYFNIEVVKDDSTTQSAMINIVLGLP